MNYVAFLVQTILNNLFSMQEVQILNNWRRQQNQEKFLEQN